MSRVLVGPVPASFRAQCLPSPGTAGDVRTFHADGSGDVPLGPDASWAEITTKLPPEWTPDLIVLHLAYAQIPAGLWAAPVPLVGWAADAPWLMSAYRHSFPALDLVLTDATTAARCQRLGWDHVHPALLWGLEAQDLEETEAAERDIDLLVVGNCHPAVQRERLPWLGRLATLAERHRVEFHTGVFGSGYRALLRRAKLVLNTTRPGRLSRRVLEAAAAGAVVLEAEGHAALLPAFRAGEHWALYREDNAAEVIAALLADAAGRERLAQAGQALARQYHYERVWADALQIVAAQHERVQARCAARQGQPPPRAAPVWQDLVSAGPTRVPPATDAPLLQALARSQPTGPEELAGALAAWRKVTSADPGHLLAQLNVAEALLLTGQAEPAAAQARHTLALLEQEAQPRPLEGAHLPFGFTPFRVEWDRAAHDLLGDPAAEASAQRRLLRWRLHSLLAQVTGEVAHGYAALAAGPELPSASAALGQHLLTRGQPLLALPHLRAAVAGHPLDRASAFALDQALGATGCRRAQGALRQHRRLLAQAAPHLVPPESWFQTRAATAGDLVSIIILCCNELPYTQACLESLWQHTRFPFEVILVDNGSSDGTAAFLDALKSQPGPERVEVLHNPTNRGFPAGCNQGAALARGGFLLFLNNDTLLTPGWLDGLLAALPADRPQLGLAGPLSNYAPAPQGIAVDYQDRAGLLAWAAQVTREQRGQRLAVPKLSGFCLLVRRAAWEATGGFDERFGLGLFDDDDLCKKARQAGYEHVVARDVFVHHFGSRTFAGLGVDGQRLLHANLARFRDKWGLEATAGYQLVSLPPSPLTLPATAPAAPRVSLTMIVKNEAQNLPRCLQSVADLGLELVIADTGSQDRTREIARSFGARLVEFPWVDHFGAARNAALAAATGSWVLWLDADDALDDENRAKLQRLLGQLGNGKDAYAMKVRSALDPQRRSVRLLDQVRLFPRHPQVQWEYRIHEQILPAVHRQGGSVRWSDIVIDHHGYVDPGVRKRKLDRNLRLLRLDDAERPQDAYTQFNLGWTLLDLGEAGEALLRLQRSLSLSAPENSIVRKLYVLLGLAHKQLKQPDQALARYREGRTRCPDDLELPFEEALLLYERGDCAGAARVLQELLAIPPGQFFASVDPAVRTVKAPHLLAECCRRVGQLAAAERWCRQALAAQPDHVPLWLELAETALARQDHSLLDEAIQGITPHSTLEAAILQARGHRARREYTAARRLLDEVLGREPGALGPRLLLSHILLEEGQDLPAAERTLVALLERFPGHPDATHRLQVLRARSSSPASAAPAPGRVASV